MGIDFQVSKMIMQNYFLQKIITKFYTQTVNIEQNLAHDKEIFVKLNQILMIKVILIH
jgi:hypothetical protein